MIAKVDKAVEENNVKKMRRAEYCFLQVLIRFFSDKSI